LLRILGQPALPYLDITILGVGAFLVFGRIGCFMVGCCHGRPYRWGVRYRDKHASAGFPRYLVGVPLFPIQLVESAIVLGVVCVGIAIALQRATPGEALAWYVAAYGVARFSLEFLRGDAERPYYLGFSQPQWISLILIALLVFEEFRGAI